MTDHFETLCALQLLDIEGSQRFAQAIHQAQERAALAGASQWAAIWCPSTSYAACAVVSGGGTERTCFMGPVNRAEAQAWFAATMESEPGEFNLA